MAERRKMNTPWVWAIGLLAVSSLTGCGMYPKHPGAWPGGPWGSLLQLVSHVIDFFAGIFAGNYGISLIVVTILVRFLVLPLMIKQIRYSKVMQSMQPQIADIRAKYKGDPKKVQEETMKLWQQAGVNPMAGCFPMVIQLPILYALFGAIEGNIHLNQYTFLGIFNLGKPDHYFILPVLAALTTYFSSKVMMTGNDAQSRMMLFIMPVFVLMIGSRFASGLALYWIVSNLFTTAQTYFVKGRPARATENAPTSEKPQKPGASAGKEPKQPKRGSSK